MKLALALALALTPALAQPRLSSTAPLSAFLRESVARGDAPAVVVLVTGPGGVLFHEAAGHLDLAKTRPVQKDSIFRIASMTKALTSAAVMTLVEQKRLSLDDDVARYLPAYRNLRVLSKVDPAAGTYETRPATRPITVRQLFTHTSGIGYSFSDPGVALAEKKEGSAGLLPLVHEPGARWTYGASPHVLAEIAEKITGQPVYPFLRDTLLAPLGMSETAFSVPASEAARVPTVLLRKSGQLTETPNPAGLSVAPRGDGRLFSTAADYGRFLRLILNDGRAGGRQLLQPETVRLMTQNQMGALRVQTQPVVLTDYSKPFPPGAGEDTWGLGFQIAQPARPDPALRRPGSLSWAGINNTFFWIDPQARIGVVVLMQFLPFCDESALRVLQGVERHVYQALRR